VAAVGTLLGVCAWLHIDPIGHAAVALGMQAAGH
jgi:hypothetical protein